MPNYGILNNKNSLHYSSIKVIIDFIGSITAVHVIFIRHFMFSFSLELLDEFLVCCLLNRLAASGGLMISVTWSINFPMVLLFYVSLSSVYLLTVCQLTELLAGMYISPKFNPIQDGPKSPPKICHADPTNMNLATVTPYLKRIQEKYISRSTHLKFCWHQHFFTRS